MSNIRFSIFILSFSLLFPFFTNATSLFIEPFDGVIIDSLAWNELDSVALGGSTGNITQNNSLSMLGDNNWENNGLISAQTYTKSNSLIINFDITITDCSSGTTSLIGYGDMGILTTGNESYLVFYENNSLVFRRQDGVSYVEDINTGFTCTNNTPFNINLLINESTGASLFIDGNTVPVATLTGGTFDNKNILLYTYEGAINIDNFSISDTVQVEPYVDTLFISGLTSVGDTLRGNYNYYDDNGDIENGSTYKWLISNTLVGTYTAIPGATEKEYIITSSDVNKYIRFEVTPKNDVTPNIGISTISTPVQVVYVDYINQILSSGQSNSIGTNSGTPITITQPYNNVMLTSGFNGSWGTGTSFIPMIEGPYLESMSSGMANALTFLSSSNDFDVTVGLHGLNGYPYNNLKKGTAAYNKGITQIQSAQIAASAIGRLSRVIGITIIHGETDHQYNVDANTYQSYLEEWQSDYETDVKTTTGQEGIIPLFTDQMSSHTSSYLGAKTTSSIPLGQLQASLDNPNKIILVTPKYFFDYADGLHLDANSQRWLGEYYAKVMTKVLINKEEWKPLVPEIVEIDDDIIFVDFHVPKGNLVFDTTSVSPRTHYGFEYIDSSYSASIENVEIIDTDSLKITLSDIPTGTDKRLLYAQTGVAGTLTGAQINGNAAGNLRDTDDSPSLYGNTLYNWSVHFDEPIVVNSSASENHGFIIPKSVFKSGSKKRSISNLSKNVISDSDITSAKNLCETFTQNIRKGDQDGKYSSWQKNILTEVSQLQKYLNFHGYNSGYEDGIAGNITISAVKKIQINLNTIADGIFGPITRNLINVC